MSGTPNIEGPPPPQKSDDQKSEVDTDKFKRMMKVEESDETQKRHKRTKQEEEEEEEEKVKDDKVPHSSFKELMGERKKGESPFDVKGGIKAELESEGGESVGPTRKAIAPPPVSRVKTEEERKEKEEKEERRAKKIEAESAAIAKTRQEKEKKEVKRLESTEPLKPLGAPAPPVSKEEEVGVGASTHPHMPVESLEEKEVAAPLPTPTAIQSPVESIEKKIETIPPPPFEKGEMDETTLLKKKIKSSETEKKEGELPQLTPPPPVFAPTPIERAPTPSYTSLSSEMFDLFERLIGLMTIEQTKGVSTTTVTLNMPGSVFNGCQIVLEHYSTAPHSFNLELRGSPEAVQVFNDNMNELSAAFQGSRLAFTIHLRTPSLLEEHRHLIRRKEKPKDKEEK